MRKHIVQPRLTSFDVFETLVVRETRHPQGIHGEIGRAISKHELGFFPEELAVEARLLAERLAYRERGHSFTTRDVARHLSWLLWGTAENSESYAQLEEQVERSLLRPIPANVALLAAIRARTGRVAYLSDTPHRSEFLANVLDDLGIRSSGEPVLSSCELGVTKASGRAYRRAAQVLGVRPTEITHYGDNRHSDVLMARLAGADGRFLPRADEEAARTERSAKTDASSELSAISTLIWSYTEWLLRDAVEQGIEKLWFLARDGYLVLRAARRVVRASGLPVRVGYLPFSRAAASELRGSPQARPPAARFLGDRLNDGRYALVDLGWRGIAAAELIDSVALLGLPPPVAFYFVGYYGTPNRDIPIVSFINDPSTQTGFVLHTAAIRLFEAVSTALTGTVSGFWKVGDEARPRLAPLALSAEEAHRIRGLQERLLSDSERQFPTSEPTATSQARLRLRGIQAAESLEAQLADPTSESADLWCTIPIEDEGRRTTLGRGYGASDIGRKLLRRPTPEPRLWREGSWLVSPAWIRRPRELGRGMLTAARRNRAINAVRLRLGSD